jgi:hypothetical protein
MRHPDGHRELVNLLHAMRPCDGHAGLTTHTSESRQMRTFMGGIFKPERR